MNPTDLIVYQREDEIIVTTPKAEKEMIEAYFTKGGRDTEDYTRNQITGEVVHITFSTIAKVR